MAYKAKFTPVKLKCSRTANEVYTVYNAGDPDGLAETVDELNADTGHDYHEVAAENLSRDDYKGMADQLVAFISPGGSASEVVQAALDLLPSWQAKEYLSQLVDILND